MKRRCTHFPSTAAFNKLKSASGVLESLRSEVQHTAQSPLRLFAQEGFCPTPLTYLEGDDLRAAITCVAGYWTTRSCRHKPDHSSRGCHPHARHSQLDCGRTRRHSHLRSTWLSTRRLFHCLDVPADTNTSPSSQRITTLQPSRRAATQKKGSEIRQREAFPSAGACLVTQHAGDGL
jgi:hypothetical protein